MKNIPNSVCVWHGKSKFDNKPIMAIASGLTKPSANRKTGVMIQTYIIRQDIAPHVAVWEEEDQSVCGDCPMRVNRWKKKGEQNGCYVNLAKEVRGVYESWQKGNIPCVHAEEFAERQFNVFERPIREGSYGEPSIVPKKVWELLNSTTKDIGTSYTHMWNKDWYDKSNFERAMASVESVEGKERANKMGARTYRVIDSIDELLPDEIQCPNNYNKAIQCSQCGLCSGGRKNAVNIATIRI